MTLWSPKGALAVLVCQHPRRSWLWYNYAMSNPAVSVILPVHDAERYLRECIDSVLAQTLREIEVICVDDASTDSSPAILAEYAKRDSRVRVITNSSNRKSGTSRNTGLGAARGKFLCFIDNDDILPEPDALADLVSLAERDGLDMVLFAARQFFEDDFPESAKAAFSRKKSMATLPDSLCGKVMPGGQLLDMTRKLGVYNCYLWTRLFRTECIRRANLRFIEDTNYDDTVFTPLATLSAERACAVNRICYGHRIRIGSVMATEWMDPTNLAWRFEKEKSIFLEWVSERVQARIAAAGSIAANDIGGGFLRHMGTLFAQMPEDDAQQILDGFGSGIHDRLAVAHLKTVRALSRKLNMATQYAVRLKAAEERRESERERLARTKERLAKQDVQLREAKARLQKALGQRDSRPNSVRACLAFVFRRLLSRLGFRRQSP